MSIKFIVENKQFIVDRRIIQTSQLFEQIFSDGNYEMTIESPLVSAKSFEAIIDYYEFNEYNPTIIEKIHSNPDVCFLNLHDKELIMKYSVTEGTELQDLLNAAIYLNMKAFKKLCLARIAFEFALDKNNFNQRFGEMKKKLAQENLALSYGAVEKQKKEFPNLTYQFK